MKKSFSMCGAFVVFVVLLTATCFICGLSSIRNEEKCDHPKAHSYLGFVVMPFRNSFWLGCELAEQRFNLNEGAK
jgi:hypothetical protein